MEMQICFCSILTALSNGTPSGETGAGSRVIINASESVVIRGEIPEQPGESNGRVSTISTITSGSGSAGSIRLITPALTIEDENNRVDLNTRGLLNTGVIATPDVDPINNSLNYPARSLNQHR
jgi:hypothetical protein